MRIGIRVVSAIVLSGAVGSGCMTLDTQNDALYTGPRTFSGSRASAAIIGNGFWDFNFSSMMFGLFDLPFSLVADTLLLPLTIPAEMKRSAEITARLQSSSERASLVTPKPGEDPIAIAERLFTICEDHLHRLRDTLADCYSIGAAVDTSTPGAKREWTGAQYKSEVRRGLRELRYRGEFVDLKEPRFRELEGGRVEMTAQRATASSADTTSFRWLLGPGGDGGWRVLEESSAGWPPVKSR